MEGYFLKDQLLSRMRAITQVHDPDELEFVRVQDISILCDLLENMVPAIDLLQARLEKGEYLEKQDGEWCLFEKDGEGVCRGKTLKDILVDLIFMDCKFWEKGEVAKDGRD